METNASTSQASLDALGHTSLFRFARDYVELSKVLGVTRHTVREWRKLSGAPTPASNGKHDVVRWREFVRAKKLKGGVIETDSERRLKARKLLAEVEEREMKVQNLKKEWVRIEEVQRTWAKMAASVTTLLRNKFENELPPILSGLDAVGIQDENRKAIDEVLAILHDGG